MSKTVKRVTRVMIVGLVAMLGAKAEAHYTVRYGKAYYCSVDVVAKLTGVDPIDLTAEAESVVTTKKVEYSCSDGTRGQSTEGWTLTARRLIHLDRDQDQHLGITVGIKTIPPAPPVEFVTAELVIIVSDQPLLDRFCPTSSGEIIIRSMSVVINIYTAARSVLASTAEFKNCTLSNKYNLSTLPPIGFRYDCYPGSYEHLDQTLP
jgi:hypothetical protein